LLRERLSSMTLQSRAPAHVLVEVLHAADVDQRGGQEAAHAEVEDQAALDDLDDGALDRLAALGASSMRFQAFSKRARFLTGSGARRRPPW
jgi:hypothetical protein